MATVNRLADVLECEGDQDDADQRRAKALGLLAQPARALQLLIAHQHAADGSAAEPPEGEPGSEPDHEPNHQALDLTPPADLTNAADLLPRVVLHFHLSDSATASGHGVVRPEHGEPTSLRQLRTWLAETGSAVTVRPVLDPADVAAVDAYETPLRMRDALLARHPAEVFPFGAAVRRNLDADHSVSYLAPSRGGPPGRTGLHNLGPLARSHHRAVTHGRWRRRQPEPGTYLFRSPHGYVFVVTTRARSTSAAPTSPPTPGDAPSSNPSTRTLPLEVHASPAAPRGHPAREAGSAGRFPVSGCTPGLRLAGQDVRR